MVEQSWKRDWSKDFKSDHYKDVFNPSFILAKILEQRGLGVSINQTVIRRGEYLSEIAEIHESPQGRDVIMRVNSTPEFLALSHAKWRGKWPGIRPKPSFELCEWDEQTKRQVEAFYWQNVVTHYQRILEERLQTLDQGNAWHKKVIDENKKMIDERQVKVQELLGELSPLTPDEIRSLLEEVVDRVLAQVEQAPTE